MVAPSPTFSHILPLLSNPIFSTCGGGFCEWWCDPEQWHLHDRSGLGRGPATESPIWWQHGMGTLDPVAA